MKSLPHITRVYFFTTYLAGVAILISHLGEVQLEDAWLLVVLCILASLAVILKVEGSTDRSHYTFSFAVYGFTFVVLGVCEAMIVILVSNVVEWLWYKPPFFLKLFEISTGILSTEVAGTVFLWVHQGSPAAPLWDIAAIILAMTTFNVLGHLMEAALPWMGYLENLRKSGEIDLFPFMLDLSLLFLGASLSVVWNYNPHALVLFIIPTHLLYSALRVPALERKTEIDSKTGLFNQTYFKKQLEGELARSNRFDRPLSVIIADLDLLRNINNTYGHLAGDEVLIGVAQAMKQIMREYDVLSRFGGEEFAILLPETTLLQAYERAEEFRKMIEGMEFSVPTSLTPIRATMSFGVAHRENARQTPNEIVHNADLALYNSKLTGRNRTFAHFNNVYIGEDRVQSNNPSTEISLNSSSTYSIEN